MTGDAHTRFMPLPSRPRLERLAEDAIRCWAPAKINLNLLVGAVRADGFHPLDSIVAVVTLYDQIDLRRRSDNAMVLRCEGLACGPDEENVALRAARAMQAQCGAGGADIELTKIIPPATGLGGGSSDAAAVVAGLCRLYDLDPAEQGLAEIALGLGSDVPLFLGPVALRMTGRGEHVEPVAVHPFLAVLVLPALTCSTGDVYKSYDADPTEIGRQVSADRVSCDRPSQWRQCLVNDLAGPARRVCPALGELQDQLQAAVGSPVHVTGSGSGLFVLCDDASEAVRTAEAALAAIGPDGGAEIVVVGPAE